MDIEQIISDFIGKYGWLFLTGFMALLFKGTIENFYKGLMVFFGTNLKNDDIILYKGKRARVVRKGIWKTVIYIHEESELYGERKLVITNSELKSDSIEILLDQDYDRRN